MQVLILNRKQFFEAVQHLKYQKGSAVVVGIEDDKVSLSMESGLVKEVQLVSNKVTTCGVHGTKKST